MTPLAASLRIVALRFAEELMDRGHIAVAATGSVARGDSLVGSDIDLWVIGDRDETLSEQLDDVPITAFIQTLETATRPSNLSLFDVDHLWTIIDPNRCFDRIRADFDRHRAELRRRAIDGTVIEIFTCLQYARRGSAEAQLVYLREAAIRIAGLDVGLATGIRVPRFRHYAKHYNAETTARLRRLLGLESDRARLESIIAAAEPSAVAVEKLLRRRLGVDKRIHPPYVGLMRLRSNAVEEGLLAIRTRFEEQCIVPMRQAGAFENIIDDAVAHLPRATRRYWQLIQGLPSKKAECKALARSTRRDLADFLAATAVCDMLSAHHYLTA